MITPELVLKTVRAGICDMQFFGFIIRYKNGEILYRKGIDNDEPFFMRSLAKPLQASIMKDFDTHNFYNLTDTEIAISLGSHTGENNQIEIVKKLLSHANLSEKHLKCGIHKPLGKHKNEKPINNNCSGKHALMLLICAQMGWDIRTYLDFNHPLQLKIKKKIAKLCETDENALIPSLDGCNAPIYGLPLLNIIKGYENLFFCPDYDFMKNAVLNNPLIFGGENRLDSEIIVSGNGKLFAKVGAGGFVIILNFEKQEILLIKMAQDNNVPRKILASKLLKNYDWLNFELADDKILTQNGTEAAHYELV